MLSTKWQIGAQRRRWLSGLTKPWPAMMRTIYGDPDRYVETYWSEIPGNYFAGDGARATRTVISGLWAASMM